MKKSEKKNIMLLSSSSIISKIGNILFDYSNSVFIVGLNINSQYLIALYQGSENLISVLVNIVGGVLADRLSRKRILFLTEFLSSIVCLILVFMKDDILLLYGIILVNIFLSILSSLSSPAQKSYTKEVVERRNIGKFNSILETLGRIVKIVSPLISLSLVTVLGVKGVLMLNSISFFLSSILILKSIPLHEYSLNKVENKKKMRIFFSDIKDGFRYLFNKKSIFKLIIYSSLINFILSGYNLWLPFSNKAFGTLSGSVYANVLSAEAIGGVIGAIASGFLTLEKRSMILPVYIMGAAGIPLILLSVAYHHTNSLILICILITVFNFLLMIFNIQFFTKVQQIVDDEYIGRVFSIIFSFAVLLMPLGSLIFSLMFNVESVINYSIIGGGIIVVSILFINFLKKEKTSC